MSTEALLEGIPPPHAKAEKLCYSPPTHHEPNVQDYLIWFISGNPGVIRFYEPFLSQLHRLLSSNPRSSENQFHICGHSYKGFETAPAPETELPESPLGLDDQFKDQENLLYKHVREHHQATGKPPKVILMGHSVGAYIVLEIIRNHKPRISQGLDKDFDLIGGILLFPTITYIAQSPLGRIARIILPLPGFPTIIGAIAKTFASVLPVSILNQLVRWFTRFPDYAAATTTAFIRSRMGVRQALHLAKEEMEQITGDKWDAEVWGAATAPGTNNRDTISSNLVLYWGQNDAWVADHTRDKLTEARGRREFRKEGQPDDWKPVMLIDNQGIPHDFCTTIRNSNLVADKVNSWIDGIVEAHRKEIS